MIAAIIKLSEYRVRVSRLSQFADLSACSADLPGCKQADQKGWQGMQFKAKI